MSLNIDLIEKSFQGNHADVNIYIGLYLLWKVHAASTIHEDKKAILYVFFCAAIMLHFLRNENSI